MLISPPERYHMPPERHHMKQLDQLQLSLDQRSRPRNLYLTSMMPMQLYRRRIASRRLVSRGSGPSLTTTLLYRNPRRFSLTTTFRTWNPRQHRTPLLSTTTHAGDAATEHSPASSATPDCAISLPPYATLIVQRPFAGAKSPATSLVVISPVPTRSKSYGAKTSSPPPHWTRRNRVCQGTHTAPTRIQGQDATRKNRPTGHNGHAWSSPAEASHQSWLQGIQQTPFPTSDPVEGGQNKGVTGRSTHHSIKTAIPDQDSRNGLTSHKLNRRFAALVSKGNIHAPISLITEHNKGGVLELTPEVRSAHTLKRCYTASCLRSTLSCLNLSLVTQYAGPLWPLRVRLVHLWPTRTSGDDCSSHSKPHLTTCAALLLVLPDVWQLSTWILSVCQLSSTTAWFHSTRTLGCAQSASVRRYGASSVSP